ncbi:putative tail completion protein [Acinetobacter phage Mithridates]|nr:putative tail completion protein [Acinetobacter phage Mithridates]
MARGGLPEWQKARYRTTYAGKKAYTVRHKNLTMHVNTEKLEALKGELVNLSLQHVRYGIVDDNRYPTSDPRGRGGMYVATIWKRLEFGSVDEINGKARVIPPRPTFTQHVHTGGKGTAKLVMMDIMHDVFTGKSVRDKAWVKLGLAMQSRLKFDVMTQKGFVPLKLPSWSDRSSTDFYNDTGHLIRSISYRIMPIGLDFSK